MSRADELDHTTAASVANATHVKLDSDPGTKIAHNDTGYLLLGFVAERVAKTAYGPLCRQVFEQVGLPADAGIVDQTLAARAQNGGWSISTESYAKFLNAFNDSAKVLSPEVLQWISTQAGDQGNASGPCPRFSGMPAYGLGVCINRTTNGVELYHDSLLHHDKYYPETGGSFFFVNEKGYAAVVISR
jgi:CubicO group peptidase (beta-lactamase class C family)